MCVCARSCAVCSQVLLLQKAVLAQEAAATEAARRQQEVEMWEEQEKVRREAEAARWEQAQLEQREAADAERRARAEQVGAPWDPPPAPYDPTGPQLTICICVTTPWLRMYMCARRPTARQSASRGS